MKATMSIPPAHKRGAGLPSSVPVYVYFPNGDVVKYPSLSRVSESLGCAVTTVRRAVENLRPFQGHYMRKVGDDRPFQPPLWKVPMVDDKGIVYPNVTTASLLTGIPPSTIYKRLRRGLYQYKTFLPE